MQAFWNERYEQAEYIYGTQPNVFFARELSRLVPGRLLLPAEGEGRNAVFAATKGWQVQAVDFSAAGKEKARQLARQHHVTIDYEVANAVTFAYPKNSFDAVGLIYAHFNEADRQVLFPRLIDALVPGGKMIMEVFHTSQLGRSSGGPKTENLLYTAEDLRNLLGNMDIAHLDVTTVPLDEGSHHQGEARVVRVLATKK